MSDTPSNAYPLILAKELVKNYRLGNTHHLALNKVSIHVAPGECLAIAGTSGSGKTTLLNILGGIDKPDLGEVSVLGTLINRLKDKELSRFRAEKIGFVFQTFNLIPTLTALENVEYPLMLLGLEGKERKDQAKKAMAEVGLAGLESHWPSTMSGGQRQRVAVARAIVKKPALVIADEPTASLDRATATELLKLMKRLNQQHGTTFVVSSHDPLVLEHMTRVFYMADGKQALAPEMEVRRVA